MQTTTITTAERRAITESILSKPLLRGLDRTKTKGQALNVISECLSNCGFNLNMVSGDTIMGDKGQRQLMFRRKGEDQSIDNASINFVWEDLGWNKYEFLAYVC